MIRLLLFALLAAATPIITDVIVDYQFRQELPDQNVGYSKADRDGLARLIASSPGKTVYVWRTHKAATIAEVWNLTPESLDSTVDILGRRK